MTLDVLLVGPSGHGGEGVYVDGLRSDPPAGVAYDSSVGFHRSATGAKCLLPAEVALNKLVRPCAVPDMGFRALQLKRRYDLVHSHAHPVWLHGLRGTPLVMSEGSSVAVYLGDYLGWSQARMRTAFNRSRRLYRLLGLHDRLLAMQRAACVYVFSEWARQINIRWGADPAKLTVIYPGFDISPPATRTERESFTFLFVGSDFERKGGFDVVEAFAKICHDLPHTRLLIAGSDPGQPNPDLLRHSWVSADRRQRIDRRLAELERAGRAVRLPWITTERLHGELFPAADAFVMPTNAEGFGFTNIEAMGFSLPVITSTAGPAAEIVSPNETGMLVAPGDVDSLADAMSTLASAPLRAAAMGTIGRSVFEHRFTRERFRRELGALYERVAARA